MILRNYLIYSILFLCTSNGILSAQFNVLLNEKDSIILQVNQNSEPYYKHAIQAGETVYSLSKFFNSNYKDILIINGIAQNEIIDLGREISIPFNSSNLIKTPSLNNEKGIPVYYSVKKSETLFRIAHVYFDQSVESLATRNQIQSLSLQPGQLLLIGWWPIINDPEPLLDNKLSASYDAATFVPPNAVHDLTEDPEDALKLDSIVHSNKPDSSFISSVSDSSEFFQKIEIISETGIAIWERTDDNDASLLVLHRSASLGSAIKLQNPVTKNIVVAQVVGHIPENVYTDDIDIVVSKAVAHNLGALDTRFQILMTYYEQ